MTGDELVKILKFIARAAGVPKSTIFFRWTIFAYPFAHGPNGGWVGFKVLAYQGVDSDKTRIAKMALNHGLTCLTAGLASGATGLGALGDGVSGLGKFGGIKDAFGVDIGGIQLNEVLKSAQSPEQIASAIISSNKLLQYAIVRVDRAGGGHSLYYRADTRPNTYTEWGVNNIANLQQSSTRYSVFRNGIIMRDSRPVGNYKTGKKA